MVVFHVEHAAIFHREEFQAAPFKRRDYADSPYRSNGNGMLWQAQSEMYFRMAGGFLGLAPAEFGHWPLAETRDLQAVPDRYQ